MIEFILFTFNIWLVSQHSSISLFKYCIQLAVWYLLSWLLDLWYGWIEVIFPLAIGLFVMLEWRMGIIIIKVVHHSLNRDGCYWELHLRGGLEDIQSWTRPIQLTIELFFFFVSFRESLWTYGWAVQNRNIFYTAVFWSPSPPALKQWFPQTRFSAKLVPPIPDTAVPIR